MHSPVPAMLFCLLVVFWLPSPRAGAAPPAAAESTHPVSWQEIARLVESHPGVSAGRLRASAARAAVSAAGAVPNPGLEATLATGQPRASGDAGSRLEWGLSLTIPFQWLAQRRARVEAAGAEAEAAVADARLLRRDVLLRLRQLFWQLVYEQERVAALEDLSTQTAALGRLVRSRVEKGEARPVEQIRMDVEAQKLAGELDLARAALEARGRQLGLWLGGGQSRARADLTALPEVLSLEEARRRAFRTHPALLAAHARVRALRAELRAERLARVPGFALTAFATHELDRRSYGGSLAADLPVWNWSSGRIARARDLLAASEKQLEVERRELEAALIEAQASCHGAVAMAHRYQDRVMPSSQTSASVAARTYQLGEATLLEVIDARRALLETRRLYLGALVQAHIECSRLRALAEEDRP